jgi:hypothetical protein
MKKRLLINALYDTKTGDILLAHPTDSNIFVTVGHYNEIKTGMHTQDSKCVYTEEIVCTLWTKDPNGPGMICSKEKKVTTCECTGGC